MLLEAVVVAFVLTQASYVAVNCVLLSRFVRRPATGIDDATFVEPRPTNTPVWAGNRSV